MSTSVTWSAFLERVDNFAEKSPSAIAISDPIGQLSYADLVRQAHSLAATFRRTTEPGAIVAVDLGRRKELLTTLLACLISGNIYAPIDPDWPDSRKAMFRDVVRPEIWVDFPVSERSLRVVCCGSVERFPETDGAGYIIFTSGSTGQPKAVVLSVASLCHVISYSVDRFGLNTETRLLGTASPAFDFSVFELMAPIAAGGSVHLSPKSATRSPEELTLITESYGINTIAGTPTLFEMLTLAGWAPTTEMCLILGGEALNEELSLKLSGAMMLWNIYGPTETTIFCLSERVVSGRPVGLGDPVSGTLVRLRTAEDDIASMGELCVTGPGVAIGYLGDSARTKERFLVGAHPTEPGPTYLTGDIARRGSDGRLYFVGRSDQQVKVNGHRVELGEIEHAASQVIGAAAAIVIPQRKRYGLGLTMVLDESMMTSSGLSVEDLMAGLADRLPSYAIPKKTVTVASFPVSSNGKVDRQAIQSEVLARADKISSESRESRGSHLDTVISAFKKVLETDAVDAHCDFFAAGGDSLGAVHLVATMRKSGLNISTGEIYDLRTPERISADLDSFRSDAAEAPAETPTPRDGNHPIRLTPSQLRFLDRGASSPRNYVEAVTIDLNSRISSANLNELAQALQIAFPAVSLGLCSTPGDELVHRLGPIEGAVGVDQIVTGIDFSDAYREISRKVSVLALSLDVRQGPLAYLVQIITRDASKIIALFHHWVCDGISLKEYERFISERTSSKNYARPSSAEKFESYGNVLSEYFESSRSDSSIASLMRQDFADHLEVRSNPVASSILGVAVEPVRISSDELASLYQARLSREGLLDDIALTAVAVAVRDAFGVERFLVDVTRNGRNGAGLDFRGPAHGWISSTVPAAVALGSGFGLAELENACAASMRQLKSYETAWFSLSQAPRASVAARLVGTVRPQLFLNVTSAAMIKDVSSIDRDLLEDFRGARYPYAYAYPIEIRVRFDSSGAVVRASFDGSQFSDGFQQVFVESICSALTTLARQYRNA